MITVQNLSFSYGQKKILNGISFALKGPQLTALLGGNGAGKSTLLRCMLHHLHPQSGSVALCKKEIGSYSARALAQRIAYIPQLCQPAPGYTVLEQTLLGRTAHLPAFAAPQQEDEALALAALRRVGLEELAQRQVQTLSGGEQRLALIARGLCQGSDILFLDEPLAGLDYGNIHRVMQCLCALRAQGATVLMTLHDPQVALYYADRILALSGGELAADGPPKEVLTSALLQELYGIAARVVPLHDTTVLVYQPGTLQG